MIKAAFRYRAKLDWGHKRHPIYDVDSFRLIVDLGCGVWFNMGMCRLYGINGPEMKGPEKARGILARDYLRDIMGDQDFVAETLKKGKGKYGRFLIKAYLPDGTFVNEHLVEKGHAIVKEY